MSIYEIVLYSTIVAMIPLLIASVGELVVEKSGVLNLGIEGMMLVGCITSFIVAYHTNSITYGLIAAIISGFVMGSIFAFLILICKANQVVSGLSLSIFGFGLSSFIGLDYEGVGILGLKAINIDGISDMPIIGPLLFNYNYLVYFSILLVIATHYFLFKSRLGLVVRAVGENHDIAHIMGYKVLKIRYLAIVFGGVTSAIAGAYISLVYTPIWSEGMTSGRGWIVLALVVFSTWKPYRLLFGAFLFGFVSIIQLFLQTSSDFVVEIPTEFFSMLPYVTTILVLVVISANKGKRLLSPPGSLGLVFKKSK